MNLTDIRVLIEKQRKVGLEPVDLSTGAFLMPPSEPSLTLINNVSIKNLNYTASIGAYSVREELANVCSEQFGYPLKAEQIAIVSGGTEGVFLCVSALENAKLWIHTRPGWHTFDEICNILNRKLTYWKYSKVSFNDFCNNQQIDKRDMGFFLNTPVNPTGDLLPLTYILSQQQLSSIFDLTYLGMTLENSNDYFVSVVDYGLKNIERTCLVFSLSKLFRIPGLRLGFVISDADIISRIATLKSAVSLNVPYDFQNLVANLWKNKDKEISDVQLYLNRRNRWLKEMCTERNIKSISHQSTHYRVIACPGNYDGFLLNLANAGIFVAPCDRMGLPNHIRINISCKDEYICKLLDQIAVLNVEG